MREVVLVTGGARGIGEAVCKELAQKGVYHILVNYNKSEKEAYAVHKYIVKNGGSAELLNFDVTNFVQVKSVIDDWCLKNQSFITALVNNAGITRDNILPFMSSNEWNDVIATTLMGFYNVTKSVLPNMLKYRHGNIINVASVAGFKGVQGQTNYSAAKAGLIGATKSLAVEVAKRNIRVNAVAPGYIDTDMTASLERDQVIKRIPMERFGLPKDVAKVISFLLSEDSAYMTGETLRIDGGLTL